MRAKQFHRRGGQKAIAEFFVSAIYFRLKVIFGKLGIRSLMFPDFYAQSRQHMIAGYNTQLLKNASCAVPGLSGISKIYFGP
jgi:hypothetical protein